MKADQAALPASPIRPALLDEASTLGGAFTTLAERFPAWPCLTVVDHEQVRPERREDVGGQVEVFHLTR